METPTIGDIIRDTAERGMGDLLIAVADYFYCLGAGIIPPPPSVPGRAELLSTLACLHQIEVLAPRGRLAPPHLADELPGRLPAMRDTGWGDAEFDGWPV